MKVSRLLGIAALTVLAVGTAMRLSDRFRAATRFVARDGTAPYERFAAWGSRTFRGWSAWTDVLTANAQNQELRRRVQTLETELLSLQVQQADNVALRRQLGFARSLPGLVAAEVLSQGGSDGWSQRLRIGKGRRHGIRPNCPVLAPQGLVGRVVEVTPTTADVLLITDPNSQVACVFDPDIPSARGILVGGGMGVAGTPQLQLLHVLEPLRLAYLEKDLAIPPQARVVTSGLGGVYPRGLAVGMIVRTFPDASGLFQRADVVPFVDFSALRHVAVWVGSDAPALGGAQP